MAELHTVILQVAGLIKTNAALTLLSLFHPDTIHEESSDHDSSTGAPQ